MKVKNTVICVNCDEVYAIEPGMTGCPCCSSSHHLELRRLIKTKEEA